MFAAYEGLKFVAALVVGLTLGWAGSGLYASTITIPAAREAGRVEERYVHAQELAAARQLAEQDAAKAQAAINAVEAEYYERDKARQEAMASLEAALEQEEKANVPTPSPSTGVRVASPACRPAISRGVRDALQRIGRASAGTDSSKSDAAVRPSR